MNNSFFLVITISHISLSLTLYFLYFMHVCGSRDLHQRPAFVVIFDLSSGRGGGVPFQSSHPHRKVKVDPLAVTGRFEEREGNNIPRTVEREARF